MKNYLLLLALAWMPFLYGSRTNTLAHEEETALTSYENFDIEKSPMLIFAGCGELIINLIPRTAEPSIEVFIQKEGKREKITAPEKINTLIAIRDSTPSAVSLSINPKKDDSHQIIVRINTNNLKQLHVVGKLRVTINENVNSALWARYKFTIRASEESAITIHNLVTTKLWISSTRNSRIAFDNIRVQNFTLLAFDNSEFTGTRLQVSHQLELDTWDQSTITIKQLEALQLNVIGSEITTTYLEGKVKSADISLHNKSILTAPQLHIKEGKLKMQDNAQAHLSIENIEEQEIKDEAHFENEAQ